MKEIIRCPWCESSEIMREYHDREWGLPNRDQRHHFEHLILEIFQAGLNWLTILKKRENFRQGFVNFDPEKIARFSEADFDRLMADSGIIRNRLKIQAAIHNAGEFLKLIDKEGSFVDFVLKFKPNKPVIYKLDNDIPAQIPESAALAKELKNRGFKFVGPSGIYAYMQSVGLVNDHLESCFRFAELEKIKIY